MKNLKQKLATGKAVIGLFMASGCTSITEIAAGCGYDFLIIDGEHGQCDERSIFQQICALRVYDVVGLVRIPAYRHEYVKRMLDFGADGILAPMIETPEQAREYACSMKYPPEGTRGMTGIFRATDYNNEFDEYYAKANSDLLCAAQIESAKGVENVDAIASTPGIDLLFIGHSDLSSDYGCYKQFSDPRVQAAEEKVIQAARRNGKYVGMVLRPGMNMDEYVERGVNFICMGTDLGLIKKTFKEKLSR